MVKNSSSAHLLVRRGLGSVYSISDFQGEYLMKTMINWFEIPCTDFDRAVKFYNTIFEIKMPTANQNNNDLAFFFNPEEGISGAISACSSLTPGVSGPRIYLNANGKLAEVVGRVSAAGGEVLVPITPNEHWGSMAVVKDTEGNSVGIHSCK